MKQYYNVVFQYEWASFYCIWYTNDVDSFVVQTGDLVFFENEEALRRYCQEAEIICEDDATLYDVVQMKQWIQSEGTEVDCRKILAFWNIFVDFFHAMNVDFMGNRDELLPIYEKIFYGNNLPSVRRLEEKYVPGWSVWERIIIRKVMQQGIDFLDSIFIDKDTI